MLTWSRAFMKAIMEPKRANTQEIRACLVYRHVDGINKNSLFPVVYRSLDKPPAKLPSTDLYRRQARISWSLGTPPLL